MCVVDGKHTGEIVAYLSATNRVNRDAINHY